MVKSCTQCGRLFLAKRKGTHQFCMQCGSNAETKARWYVREMLGIPHPGKGVSSPMTKEEAIAIHLYRHLAKSPQKMAMIRRILFVAKENGFIIPAGYVIIDDGISARYILIEYVPDKLRDGRPLFIVPTLEGLAV